MNRSTEERRSFPVAGEPRRDAEVENVKRTALGKRLRDLRLAHGLTAEEVGVHTKAYKDAAIAKRVMCQYERTAQVGKTSTRVLKRIAKFYDMTVSELIEGAETEDE